ncbi:hypothetical protein GMLC_43370 [Geomonas limicola]|uniref:histidine kinase n=1 Tax=Geomonas limicola TaxID=2740186 RepID=A0A6V8NDP4_9BACT|nr:ATP-binding protein [Geomonas limicola]GFO70758.1 hypothetical protein GMLC_43370 [Geomonas limicola]
MTQSPPKSVAALEAELAEASLAGRSARRQIALLSSIVSVLRETANCQTEEEMAQVCLRVAEDLTGSAYGFIGELNEQGLFDTTLVSERGWAACRMPTAEAVRLLKSMPNRGINRIGLQANRSWIVNDVGRDPNSVPRPTGHPELSSFLGVPLSYAGGSIGMIGLANKPSGYSSADREEVEALAAAFIESLNRRRAEKRVAELNAELSSQVRQVEAANKELENFSYSMSHDLRAPVRHLNAYLELLGKQDLSVLDHKSHHYLEVIRDAAENMALLVDGLLSFLHLGRVELKGARVDLGELVNEVILEMAGHPDAGRVDWQIAPLPEVWGDREMLRTVFQNLVANALKFSRDRQEIEIEIGTGSGNLSELVFFVRDNGVGFDMRYQHKLFGLFQRLHSNEEFKGTGVGLASVQRIIQRHGGRVWASSVLGEGATLWFSLPRQEEIVP